MALYPPNQPTRRDSELVVLAGVILGSAVQCFAAAQLKEAQVTEVVKDVKLLPYAVQRRVRRRSSDDVRDGTAVRTGSGIAQRVEVLPIRPWRD